MPPHPTPSQAPHTRTRTLTHAHALPCRHPCPAHPPARPPTQPPTGRQVERGGEVHAVGALVADDLLLQVLEGGVGVGEVGDAALRHAGAALGEGLDVVLRRLLHRLPAGGACGGIRLGGAGSGGAVVMLLAI